MNAIVIDGVVLTDLKVRYEALAQEQAEMRGSIRKGSSKYLSDKTDEVEVLIKQLKDVKTEDEAVVIAEQIIPILKDISFVSDVSGVAYTIPYYNRQQEYYPNGDSLSHILEDGDNDVLTGSDNEILTKLYNIAESMESEVCEWNTSYC